MAWSFNLLKSGLRDQGAFFWWKLDRQQWALRNNFIPTLCVVSLYEKHYTYAQTSSQEQKLKNKIWPWLQHFNFIQWVIKKSNNNILPQNPFSTAWYKILLNLENLLILETPHKKLEFIEVAGAFWIPPKNGCFRTYQNQHFLQTKGNTFMDVLKTLFNIYDEVICENS